MEFEEETFLGKIMGVSKGIYIYAYGIFNFSVRS